MNDNSETVGARAVQEVRERHDFFADWFAGRLDAAQLDQAMHGFTAGFTHVGPDGVETDRPALEAMLRSRHATKPAEFEIVIESPRVLIERDGLAVVSYVEIQADVEPPARISTAVFEVDDRAPLGVAWRHVQETWLNTETRS